MMRSMFAGVSGLRNHQTRMDVIGNNIANVNTVGYKSSRVTFQDTLSQILRGATAPQNLRGGVNPLQVGLGTTLSTIDVIHTAGNLQTTGVNTDLALQGNGFFILGEGAQQYYTRAGNFSMDSGGRLVYPNGLQLQGWMARGGVISTSGRPEGITLPINSTIAPRATTTLAYNANFDSSLSGSFTYGTATVGTAQVRINLTPTGNQNEWEYQVTATGGTVTGDNTGIIRLNKDGTVASVTGGGFTVDDGAAPPETFSVPAVGALPHFTNPGPGGNITATAFVPPSFSATAEVFDSLGNSHLLTTTFTMIDDNTWTWSTDHDLYGNVGSGGLIFGTDGVLQSPTGGPIIIDPPGADQVRITPDFLASTQYAAKSAVGWEQDGYPMGYLESFKIDSAGRILGIFTNGLTEDIAQVAVATFSNPGGMEKIGETMFAKSSNSGQPQINPSGVGGSGKVTPGALEMSNVDLSQEFTDMIITQRGFQANSRIITTSDEMLQELVNLKR